jgi:hypothetical protein
MAIWAVSNILNCKPYLSPEDAEPGLMFMCEALAHNYHDSSPDSVCLIVNTLLNYSQRPLLILYVKQGIIEAAIAFAKHHNQPEHTESIRRIMVLMMTFSNCTTFVVEMVQQGLFELCQNLLSSSADEQLIIFTLFVLSNVAADTQSIVDALLSFASLPAILAKVLEQGSERMKK